MNAKSIACDAGASLQTALSSSRTTAKLQCDSITALRLAYERFKNITAEPHADGPPVVGI